MIFTAVMLAAAWHLVDVTWLKFAYSIAFAAVLTAWSWFRHRGKPFMSDATQKITRHDVKLRGEPVTIEMIGTPQYPCLSRRERFIDLLLSLVPLPVMWSVLTVWPELLEIVMDQGWPFLGPVLWMFFLSIYGLVRAP